MKEIILTRGFRTQVDDDDYEYLMKWSWHTHCSNGVMYAARCYKVKKKVYISYMHRQIAIERKGLITPSGMLIDHEDQDSLNNQKYNLRIVDLSINGHNSRMHSRNTSGVRGVRLNGDGLWTARLHLYGKDIWLGTFSTKEEATEARRLAEIEYNPKGL